MESPRSCPTRLCRTEGSPQCSVETPPRTATAERATLGLGPQNTAVQHWQPVGVNHLRTRRGGGATC